jgi:hypothetical protein
MFNMKTYLLAILMLLLTTGSFAQTATNFTANDCAGVNHNLFTELDAGKVIVLCWVMPCGACVPGSLTTSNVVKSYQLSNPNTVLFYLVDDLANTSCTSLNSWANSNHISPEVTFSNASINMLDYGTQAMPKVVVLGGSDHHVFLVADAVVDPTELQDAINAAMPVTGLTEETTGTPWATVFPNPANDKVLLTVNAEKNIPIKAELFSIQGLDMGTIYTGIPLRGENHLSLNLSQYLPGVYFIRLSDAERAMTIRLTIKH